MIDERKGLPSASAAHRYFACPGSWMLENQFPDGPASSDATIGNRIHAALAGDYVADITQEEKYIIERCKDQAHDLVVATFGNDFSKMDVYTEERLWATDCITGEKLWSGKPDVVYVLGNNALIVDYKTGRGLVEDASKNLQLRCLVELVHENFSYEFNTITVAIVQPLAGSPSVCKYEFDDIENATAETLDLMERIKTPGQRRIPSDSSCRYCKGKPYCSEARELAVTGPLANAPEGITPDAIAATLTSSHLAEFLNRTAQAEAVIEACKSEARRRLSEGETVEGWTLKEGSVRESISNSEIVASRFLEIGTYEQLSPAITLNKTKLKDAVKLATATKGRELESKLSALLDGCTESKMSQPMLVKIK